MIAHNVLWKLKPELSQDAGRQTALDIKQQLEALAQVIPEIQAIEVGINFNPSEAAADIALYSRFVCLADLETYQTHPEHLKVAELVRAVAIERRVADYEICSD